MSTLTLPDLEAKIGIPAGSESSYWQSALASRMAKDFVLNNLVVVWLSKQGLPEEKLRHSKLESLAKAYISPRYLAAWRNNVNPNWRLLGASVAETSLLDEDSGADSFGTDSADAAAPQAAPTSAQSAAWLKSLFAQINTTVEKLVTERLAKTELKISASVKEQIRTLASTSAAEKFESLADDEIKRLLKAEEFVASIHSQIASVAREVAKKTVEELKPRVIEVHNASGACVNVGLQHERFPTLLRACGARDHKGFRLNIWLTGPTGSGKTSACEAAAKALTLPFGSDGSLDADYKVLGFRDANGNVISTQFLDIYEHGGIYVADEIDNWLPSALLSLNAALANGWTASPRGLIKRHADACIIACANTWGLGATSDYVGRTRLDAASLDRFHPKIDWPVDERLERSIADAQGGETGTLWHDTVMSARSAARTQGLKIIISPRATFAGIALLAQGFSIAEVIDMTVASGLSAEQKKAMRFAELLTPQGKTADPQGEMTTSPSAALSRSNVF